jgi:hypothetical protein
VRIGDDRAVPGKVLGGGGHPGGPHALHARDREARDRLNAADTLLAKGAEGLGKAMREAGKE